MHSSGLAALMVAASLASALPAAAQDRPPSAPTRDVAISYRTFGPVRGAQKQQDIRVAMTAGGALMRVEGMGGATGVGYVIVDRNAQRMTMVMPQDRRFLDMPANEVFAGGFLLDDRMTFARRGSATVAGLKCTTWDVTSAEGEGTVCVTADGVMLRGQGAGGRGGIEATSVKFGPQPAALFHPPAGFSKLEMPAGALPGARPPGR